MDNGYIFKDLMLGDNPISECEMVLECNDEMYRLYMLKLNYCGGFKAMAIEFNSCGCEAQSQWESDDLVVDELFTVTAFFDGVRHLEFNRNEKEMEGYLYYPNIDGLISLLSKVREIEKELCRECD